MKVMGTKEDEANHLLCMTCLCVGRSLRKLTDVKLKQYYLDTLKEIPLCNMPHSIPNVCWECEATLQRVLAFKEQVKDSYRILQTYTNENLHECLLSDVSRPPRLKITKNQCVSIKPTDNETNSLNKEFKTENRKVADKKRHRKGSSNASMTCETKPEMDILTVVCDGNDKQTSKASRFRSGAKVKESCAKQVLEIEKCDVDIMESDASDRVDDHNIDAGEQGPENRRSLEGSCNAHDSEAKLEFLTVTYEGTNRQTKPSRLRSSAKVKESCVNQELGIEKCDVDKMESDASDRGDDQVEFEDHNVKSDSDIALDTKLAFIKSDLKMNKSLKKQRIKKTKKKMPNTSKNPQKNKMLTIELSYEDMLAERSRQAKKVSFLNAKYKCETCLIVFRSASLKKTHVTEKHAPELGEYICPICYIIVSSVKTFKAHYKRHIRRYECGVCQKRTGESKPMYKHLYTRHGIAVRQYKCNVCGKVSNCMDTHRYHKDTHKARVACGACDKTFSHRAGLMNHRLAVHELQNEFPCSVCDKVFRWRTSLTRHLEKHQGQDDGGSASSKPYCSECDIGFSSVCSLQRHLRNSLKHVTHDQLKFICDHCDSRFADKTKLRNHIEEKHLHRTYQCHICNKPSKNRVGLEQHIRNVHKGRPNNKICHHCGKGFPTKVQLESHIRTHTGERPFICEYCPTTFSQQSNLYKHHRQVHLNMKSKRYPICKKRKAENQTGDPPPVDAFTVPMQYMAENVFGV